MFADLLLQRPITYPAGKPRIVRFEDKVEKIPRRCSNHNTEIVLAAIIDGADTVNMIAAATDLARTTVENHIKLLLGWPSGPRIVCTVGNGYTPHRYKAAPCR